MNALQNALKGMSGQQLGDKIVTSGMKYMGEGTHDVRVSGVDRNLIDQNKLTVKYEDGRGLEHNDMLYPTEVNKKTGQVELNWRFGQTLGMLIPDTDAYDALIGELLAGNDAVLDLLVGLKGRVTLARTKGYSPAAAMADGTYEVRNVADPSQVYFGATIEAAQEAAEKAGLKKGYINTTKYQATNGPANVEAFAAGLKASREHKPAGRAQLGYGKGVASGAGTI